VVPRPLTFASASRILAGDEDRLINAVDHALSGLLLVSGQVGLFDPKNDLIRLLKDLRGRMDSSVESAPRRDRGDVMVAAHTIVTISAYFDELGSVSFAQDLRWQHSGLAELAGADGIAARLLGVEMPVPAASLSRQDLAKQLEIAYGRMADSTLRLLAALSEWDRWPENDRIVLEEQLRLTVPRAAGRRYGEYLVRLAGDRPAFAAWVGEWEHAATRERMHTGLEGVARRLERMAPERSTRQAWDTLARRYAADLDSSVISRGQHGAPGDLVLPVLADAYVNPAFQVTVAQGESTRAFEDSWWRNAVGKVHDDIEDFLTRYLNSPEATTVPLLVLGEPGVGKSVFTRTFAGRLLNTEFRPLRVDLRRVPADASVVDQVRLTLREALQRDVEWADLAEDSDGCTPVIFFDGYDELLQGSATSQADYLERVREFQLTSLITRDCPVAVVVTSRTIAADLVRVPDGTTIMRLEPFDERRTARWLDAWNEANRPYYQRYNLRPLPAAVVARHAELAEQPLLLLMLALYDAAGNALQHQDETLAGADLYEQLLRAFADREMRKGREHLTDQEVGDLVDQELERLAVAALAMFNRGAQSVTGEQLGEDLQALLSEPATVSTDRTAPSDAQRLVGRFFFVHVSESRYDRTLRTYEFLHSTFAEFLVAWFTIRALPKPPVRRLASAVRTEPEDGLLAAVLSHELLLEREPTIAFLKEMATGVEGRSDIRELLLAAFRMCRTQSPWRQYHAYRPGRTRDLVHAMAIYSANLVLLIILMSPDGRCRSADLFGPLPPAELEEQWRDLARLWLAGCRDSGTQRLAYTVTYSSDPVPYICMRSDRPWAAAVPFGQLRVRNDLLREPDVTALLRAVDPVMTRLGDELLPPSGEPGLAPAHGLLHVLFYPDASEQSYLHAINAAKALAVGRRRWYGDLIIKQLLARRRAVTGDAVLTGILELTRLDPSSEKLPQVVAVDVLRLISRADSLRHDRRVQLEAEILGRTDDRDATLRAVAEAARVDLSLAAVAADLAAGDHASQE
jgi:hypothetical protein